MNVTLFGKRVFEYEIKYLETRKSFYMIHVVPKPMISVLTRVKYQIRRKT